MSVEIREASFLIRLILAPIEDGHWAKALEQVSSLTQSNRGWHFVDNSLYFIFKNHSWYIGRSIWGAQIPVPSNYELIDFQVESILKPGYQDAYQNIDYLMANGPADYGINKLLRYNWVSLDGDDSFRLEFDILEYCNSSLADVL